MLPHMSEILNIPLQDSDYINLSDLNNYQQMHTLIEHPLNMCKYCDENKIKCDNFLWNSSNKIVLPFDQTLKDIYIKDYNLYNKLINDSENIKIFQNSLQDKFFLKHFEEYNEIDTIIHYKRRFQTGKKDILFFFNNDIQYKKILKIKTIILNKYKNCNIYFCSIAGNEYIENLFYTIFEPFSIKEISFWFLKAKDEQEGKKFFCLNSFLKEKENIIFY